ncbi:MAG: COX15/CtaA family protein [Phycisphaerales bacterium]|nr:COX15/CtaA family protein [Phycisphaerales bacterium]
MLLDKKKKILSYWLLLGVFMLLVQVILGGITRLTGSGLSITEWKPIIGALPPLTQQDWLVAFAHYQQIAQYKFLNNHFTLSDFKFIFFWEWLHRLWARLMALCFLLPFFYFLFKNYFRKNYILPLFFLFLLGFLQGAIGWIMVQSGLYGDNLFVAPLRLAIHFIAAIVLIAYCFIFALNLNLSAQNKDVTINKGGILQNLTIAIIVLLSVQLFLGAYLAGLHGALAAPTWPTINGDWIPDFWGEQAHLYQPYLHNPVFIQFIHRSVAYCLLLLIVLWWSLLQKSKASPSTTIRLLNNLPVILVGAQVLLGIITVLTSPYSVAGKFTVFQGFALLHQTVGILLLLSFIAYYVFHQQRILKHLFATQ